MVSNRVHRTIPDLLSDRAQEAPERPALVVADVGVLTFGEWDRRSNAIARSLIDRGLPAGRPVDRESDIIKSGAFKVSTLQVEVALYDHPAVAEAAVLGIPHPVLGRVTAAAVVTRAPVTAADLRTFLMSRLARHELPSRVLFLPELPKNHAGKSREVPAARPARTTGRRENMTQSVPGHSLASYAQQTMCVGEQMGGGQAYRMPLAMWFEGDLDVTALVAACGDVVARHPMRAHLAAIVPAHLAPSVWVPLDELPLTVTGKVDLTALLATRVAALLRNALDVELIEQLSGLSDAEDGRALMHEANR